MKKGEVDLDAELAEADERRKAMETERIKKLAELSGLDKIEKVEYFYQIQQFLQHNNCRLEHPR